MISLKRYLSSSGEDSPLRLVVSLLIARMGSTAVEADPADLAAFLHDIRRIGDGLAPDLPPENLMIVAEAAAQALAEYNKGIEKVLSSQGSEVKHILAMLQETVISIAGEHTRSGKRLQEITDELEKSGNITDLRVLKGRLTECLKGLRDETLQQKADAAGMMEKLQITIERGKGEAAFAADSGNPMDAVTGLPGRDDAIAAMQSAVDGGTRHYAVVMVVDRMKMITARFGLDVGDRMIAGFKEHLKKQLSASDRLFRWGGPALVAIIERPEPLGTVLLQVRRLLDAKVEVNYSGNGRSVLIPVSAAWSAFPIASTTDAGKQIQAFIATQNIRD
jgi:diguanylate cyclase (GGDEF)-like protein